MQARKCKRHKVQQSIFDKLIVVWHKTVFHNEPKSKAVVAKVSVHKVFLIMKAFQNAFNLL